MNSGRGSEEDLLKDAIDLFIPEIICMAWQPQHHPLSTSAKKPGSGLLGVKTLWNSASHHQQEWQKGRRREGGAEGKEAAWGLDDRGEGRQRKTERMSRTFEIHRGGRSQDKKTGQSKPVGGLGGRLLGEAGSAGEKMKSCLFTTDCLHEHRLNKLTPSYLSWRV